MRWTGRRQSTNVENRRGMSGGKVVGGGIGVTIIGLILYFITGDPSALMNQQSAEPKSEEQVAREDKYQAFVNTVLAETEDVWNAQFSQMGRQYEEPTLVTFDYTTTSGCGGASSSTGPFYCPLDHKVYIDLSFYDELQSKFGASGDFAMAYVVAHEVGHHVQTLLGISDKVRAEQQQSSEEAANALSVKLELQADFLAGLWANHADRLHDILEDGDIEEALNAAQAIGDDRLQKQSQGYSVPETFTHGTSAQRMYWFKKGYTSGDLKEGDTFSEISAAFDIDSVQAKKLVAMACFFDHH